jgi:hypothetical protein
MAKNHYVDNKQFYALMVEREKQIIEAEKLGLEKPPINDEISKIIMAIATYLSTKNNFVNYTYREDMIGDAIENFVNYLDNFDSEKSKNPFAYFTQICYYAFIRRINKESKHSEVKKKYIEKLIFEYSDSFDTQKQDSGESYTNSSLDFLADNFLD